MSTRSLLLALVTLTACGGAASPNTPAHATAAVVAKTEALPFIHDDYPKALAEAKAKHKPLFVDAWAPWCHSCVNLRAYVLTDPALASLGPDFVWLSVDTEKDANADWVTRYPHAALPTLWVVDPESDRPLLKWAGTPTAVELRALLKAATGDPSEAFVRGNFALAAGDDAGAEREFRAALATSPKDHPNRGRILEALVTHLMLKKQHAECARLGLEAATLPAGTSRATVVVAGLSCAREGGTEETPKLVALALTDARARDEKLLADDRSALYEEAFEAQRKDPVASKKLAEEWAAYLDGEATRASTSDARTALDPLRLSAYFALGEPARAVPMLERSEKDFPDDYNPPARLGRTYLELKRLDDADRAVARAIARVYGPRAMRIFSLKADIAKARGDQAGERAALEEALARSARAALTEGQKTVREGLTKRLAQIH